MCERLIGVILFAQPGRMPASLRVLLKSLFPEIQIEQTEDIASVLNLLVTEEPWMVMIDADLNENDGWLFWNKIKKNYPQHRYIILAHNAHQNGQIDLTGLPSLLLEGMTGANLAETIETFFRSK